MPRMRPRAINCSIVCDLPCCMAMARCASTASRLARSTGVSSPSIPLSGFVPTLFDAVNVEHLHTEALAMATPLWQLDEITPLAVGANEIGNLLFRVGEFDSNLVLRLQTTTPGGPKEWWVPVD